MKTSGLILVLALFAGCATQGPRGYYAASPSPASSAKVADDSVGQLLALYPPASTYLVLKQPTNDPYGTVLLGKLRSKGYAVMEMPTTGSNSGKAAVMATVGTDFGYVLDQAGTGRYRVTLNVGTQSISRIYVETNGRLDAVSFWVKRS